MTLLAFALLALQATAAEPSLPGDPNTPGCTLDVRKAGKVIASRSAGLANLETPAPITADTVLEIGSVSKQFIGAGVALLAAQGRLKLDDPIRRWLPELPPLYRGVTLRMLVNHTSGIRSWNNLAELTGRGEDSTGYDNRWVLDAVARQRALNNASGTEYLYSNSNFVLAAIVIERASGEELNAFYRRAFFDRLGMAHTRWRTDFRDVVPGRAQAYLPDGKEGWRLDMPLNGVAGAGGLLSTVGDLQRWNAALASPAPADREWVAALQRPGTLADGTPLRYGMGIELDPVGGRPAFAHAGSTGSYRAYLARFPDDDLSIALLCNSGAVNTEDLGPEIAAAYLPAIPEKKTPSIVGASPAADLAGLYRNAANDAVVAVTVDGGRLRFGNGPSFSLVDGALVSADGRRRATIARSSVGQVSGITVTRVANAPVRLVPVTAWRPDTVQLARFAGRYSGPERLGTQRIVLRGTGLVWIDPAGDEHPLQPTYRDAFDAPDTSWTLRFRRRGSGAVSAVDFSITRARKIGFSRVAS